MSRPISVLPTDLANQIAAGEVVERPASVVKELLENSLDAGATRIEVSIEAGGLERIEITDDGHGMSPADARLCVQRHATSKLRAFTDLDELLSYGFRGEALPSIASVSRFQLLTRSAQEEQALRIQIEGGQTLQESWEGAPIGSTCIVQDLFFNVPARRKFLRSTNTESSHISDAVENAALAQPQVAFQLRRDGRIVKKLTRTEEPVERIVQLLGEEDLLVARGQRGPLHIEAFLAPVERARQGTSALRLFLNGRPIKDRALSATIAHAYGTLLDRGRYPRGVLYLNLPPHLVDINVHPQKTEVRFADPRAVSEAVHSLLTRQLQARPVSLPWAKDASGTSDASASEAPSASSLASETPGKQSPPSSPATPSTAQQRSSEAPPTPESPVSTAPSLPDQLSILPPEFAAPSEAEAPLAVPAPPSDPAPPTPRSPSPPILHFRDRAPTSSTNRETTQVSTENATPRVESPSSERPPKALRFLSQTKRSYLICEGSEGIYVLDQAALSQAVLFQQLHAAYQERHISTQSLLFPLTVALTPSEILLLDQKVELLHNLGLDVRTRTETTASIHAVPELLSRVDPEELLREFLQIFLKKKQEESSAVAQFLRHLAGRAAVRSGEPVSAERAQNLLNALEAPPGEPGSSSSAFLLSLVRFRELERKRSSL